MDFAKRLIIAELGMTHDGSFGQAKAMIKAAADCGVDAVKLQMHISSEETVHNAPLPPYFHSEPRYEYFERTAFSMEQWKQLKDYSHEFGVSFIVSPFSIEAIKRSLSICVDAIKIPSGEITNIPYIDFVSGCDVPIIVSSGMSSLQELDECMQILLKTKSDSNIALMQCTSEYPCMPEHVGLNIIDLFHEKYPGVPLGFSDHTEGEWAAIAAFQRGAKLIEKHFTLSNLMYGPDAAMSMEPNDMRLLCNSIHKLEIAMSSPIDKTDMREFSLMKTVFQKSIVASRDIEAGSIITEDMIAYKKPGDGLETRYYKQLIGKKINRSLKLDDKFRKEDLD